jgi:hypothetical protein
VVMVMRRRRESLSLFGGLERRRGALLVLQMLLLGALL